MNAIVVRSVPQDVVGLPHPHSAFGTVRRVHDAGDFPHLPVAEAAPLAGSVAGSALVGDEDGAFGGVVAACAFETGLIPGVVGAGILLEHLSRSGTVFPAEDSLFDAGVVGVALESRTYGHVDRVPASLADEVEAVSHQYFPLSELSFVILL